MTNLTHLRALAFAFIAIFGLAACNPFAADAVPTDRFVITLQGDGKAPSAADVASAIDVIQKRLMGPGLTVHRISPGREGRIVLDVSGENALNKVAAAIGIKGDLSLRLIDTAANQTDLAAGIAPVGSEILQLPDGMGPVAVKRFGGVSGDRLASARPEYRAGDGQPVVNISFDAAGAEKFARITSANVGQPFAIVIDGEVLSTPIINEPIVGGQAQISGNFTQQSAEQLAAALASGALPARATIAGHTKLNPDAR